ncbi:MAG: ammonium transporter, partial [Balneolaceae bacterium]
PGHSIPLATVGVFLLWFGWFGFNGGSVLSADPVEVSYVFVTTALSASAGALFAMLTTQIVFRNMDAPMALNGILAGLVGITAGADVVTPLAAVSIGAVAGMIVVMAISVIDRFRIDDPVGAISVHGVCGVWGTLAVGLFVPGVSFWVQLLGVTAVVAFIFLSSYGLFSLIDAVMGVRVSDGVETQGLDLSEHGNSAYPYFVGIESMASPVEAN